MKILLIAVGLLFTNYCFAQNVYEIRADTVRIYNTCDTAELVLENRTKDTLGFLFNKGNGRTEFRRLQLEKIGISQLAITGQDTVDLNFIQNQTAADQPSSGFRISGIGRSSAQFQVVKNGSESLSPSLQLFNAAADRGANMQLDGNTNPGLSFWLQDGTAWNRSMTLTANGKLGLGTANPLFGMHITGKPGCLILESTSSFSGGSGGFIEAFNRGVPNAANQRLGGMAMGAMPDSLSLAPSIVVDALSEAAWTNNVSHPSYLRILTTPANSTQPLERMRITAAGYVGIGSTNPTTPLYVNGVATIPTLSGSGTSPLQITSGGSAQVINLLGGATGPQSNQGGAISIFGGAHPSQPGIITFYSGLGIGGTQQPERMRISAAGNVGIGTTAPAHTLDVQGSVGFAGRTLTATTTLTDTDYIVQVNNTAAATINLPAAAGVNKRIYIIKKISGASLNVTIDPSGSELIDGAATKVLTLQYSSITIYTNGTSWSIIEAYAPGMTL